MKKNKKIKIAMFADVLKENMDGVTHTLYNIINRIPKKEFEFIFLTPFPPSKDINFPYPVHVCKYINTPLHKEYPLALPFYDSEMTRVLDDFQPDIIHYTTPALLGKFAVKYGMERNIPIFHTYHTHFISYMDYIFFNIPGVSHFFTWLAKKITTWFINRADKALIPTEAIKEELVDIGLEENKLKIWGRGVDSKKYNPKYKDDEYINNLCGKNTKRVLFVSRLVWEKEIKMLVKVYNLFKEKRPDIKMIITGDGPQTDYLMKKMPNAIFTGKLINGDLAKIYASCDVFMFPSITETFGNVVLEALSSGLPAVVAAKGGPKGIVKDGQTGYHAEPKNPQDFFDKITYLLDNPYIRKQMSKSSVQYAKSQSWDNLCEDFFDTYKIFLNQLNEEVEEKHEVTV